MMKEFYIRGMDLSSALPAVIGKLDMVFATLDLLYNEDDRDKKAAYELAIDDVLKHAINDLKTINHELFNYEASPEPDTAPISKK